VIDEKSLRDNFLTVQQTLGRDLGVIKGNVLKELTRLDAIIRTHEHANDNLRSEIKRLAADWDRMKILLRDVGLHMERLTVPCEHAGRHQDLRRRIDREMQPDNPNGEPAPRCGTTGCVCGDPNCPGSGDDHTNRLNREILLSVKKAIAKWPGT
jgi:hypothetical protein